MARLGTWALLVLLLFISANARPAPEPEPAPEILLQPKSFQFMWDRTVSWAVVIANTPGCRNVLFALTGQDPVVMLLEPEFWVTAPEVWLPNEEDYAALTTCAPPLIVMRREAIMSYGPLAGAITLIHELAHVGTCHRAADGEVPTEEWENMASIVDKYCLEELSRHEF
jgi:hypothetical protein